MCAAYKRGDGEDMGLNQHAYKGGSTNCGCREVRKGMVG